MSRPFIVDLNNDSTRKLKMTLAKVGAELWDREYGVKSKRVIDVPLPDEMNV